jgi:hypothetical protein
MNKNICLWRIECDFAQFFVDIWKLRIYSIGDTNLDKNKIADISIPYLG